jgi:hypothetical protein
LFLACAILFLISSLLIGDKLLIAASVLFVLGCFVFMLPLVQVFAPGRKKTIRGSK